MATATVAVSSNSSQGLLSPSQQSAIKPAMSEMFKASVALAEFQVSRDGDVFRCVSCWFTASDPAEMVHHPNCVALRVLKAWTALQHTIRTQA